MIGLWPMRALRTVVVLVLALALRAGVGGGEATFSPELRQVGDGLLVRRLERPQNPAFAMQPIGYLMSWSRA